MEYNHRQTRWAIFPSHEQATHAAAVACAWHLGGYHNVCLHPLIVAPLDTDTYRLATDWLFDEAPYVDEHERPRGVHYEARVAMRRMLRVLAEKPAELLEMEWFDLERALFEALTGLGYDVRHTPFSKDGGYDLEVVIDGRRYLIELKHWKSGKVGSDIVERFGDIVMHERAEAGLFLSSSGYFRPVVARIEAGRGRVKLGNGTKVLSFCRSFVRSQAGVWERDGDLVDAFFSDTL
jgi:hypothetical protein